MRSGSADGVAHLATSPEELARLRRTLLRFTQRHCPPSLESEAEDLAQAAMIRLLGIIESEGSTSFPSSYLWRTAFSVVVDELRRRQRRNEVALEDAVADQLRSPAPSPEADAVSRGLEVASTDCLRELVQDRRRAVVLRLQGHSVKEVARLLEWSAKRAENLVYRGLADLRKCLEGKGFQP